VGFDGFPMRHTMLASRSPYRRLSRGLAPVADPLFVATAHARLFVLFWSLARDVVCLGGGLDFEGFLAAVIIALTLASRTRSLFP
jgi:hypothetical protein